MRTRPFLIWHAVACAVLGSAFLIVSAPHVWEAIRATSFGPILPYHTTNSYMVTLLNVQDGSERLLLASAALPPKRPIAVVLIDRNEEGSAILSSYLVSYFNWPREVHLVPVKRENAARKLLSLDRASLAAIFFCGMDPPPGLQPVIRIGSGLVMVPTAAKPEANVP